MSLLEVNELYIRYAHRPVLCGTSLALAGGSISALLGRNGAGKSTLLRCIAGLIECECGQILLAGSPVGRLSTQDRIRRGIAFVAQNRECFPDLSVFENLEVAMSCLRLARTERSQRRTEVLSLLPMLGPLLNGRVEQLSGGQQQVLVVAMALCQRPKVLLLDEPSTGLGQGAEAALVKALRWFSAEGGAVLVVEQRLQFCVAVADNTLFLDNGIIDVQGSPKGLLNTPAFISKYLQISTGVKS